MKEKLLLCLLFCCCSLIGYSQPANRILPKKKGKVLILFDGRDLKKWEGDMSVWQLEGNALVAGDTLVEQPQNDFLSTKKDYKNYVLKLKFKLEGSKGWVNSGVQLHSQRSKVPPYYEMSGFQAELASGCWGCIYDESRRNAYVARVDQAGVEAVVNKGDWNNYEIRCLGRRIVILLNGLQTVDYTEPANEYPAFGKIALQIHGKGFTKISFKDILLEQF